MKKNEEQPKKSTSVFKIIGIVIAVFSLLVFCLFGLLFFGLFASMMSGTQSVSTSGNVAVITLDGTIMTSGTTSAFSDDITSSTDIIELLKDAESDSSVEAIVLEINSPGGSGVASDEISQQVRKMNKPVISVIREVGASGAYWVASSSDYIFANRLSIVGSIGVIASSLNFAEFIDDHNITYERFVAGANKDFGTPFRNVTPAERKRFQAQLDEMHTIFIEEVAIGRGLSPEYVRTLADGFVFSGNAALNAQLIDEIGTMEDAKDYLSDKYNITADYKYLGARPNVLSALLGLSSDTSYSVGRGIGDSLKPQLTSDVVRVRT